MVKRDLGRYYRVLRDSLLRLDLDRDEAFLIVEALKGARFDEGSYRYVWAEVDQQIRTSGADERWGVRGERLVEKLRNLDPGTAMTLVDAVERFWSSRAPRTQALLIDTGLLREPSGENGEIAGPG